MKEWIVVLGMFVVATLGVFYLIRLDTRQPTVQDCEGFYCKEISCAQIQWERDSIKADLQAFIDLLDSTR